MTGERNILEAEEKGGQRTVRVKRGKFKGAEYVEEDASVSVSTGKLKALKLEPESHERFSR
jgi:hypothetical protein